MALAAYRHVLRATRIAFQNDKPLLLAARHQARHDFRRDSGLEGPAIKTAVDHAEGVAQTLRENVVQGQLQPGGGGIGGSKDVYKLNIHEHTEKGDNDTVKNPRGEGGRVKVDTGGL